MKPNVSAEALGSGSILPGGQFRAINIPVKEVIKFAFGVREETIVGAPSWTATEHYDIIGRATTGTTRFGRCRRRCWRIASS